MYIYVVIYIYTYTLYVYSHSRFTNFWMNLWNSPATPYSADATASKNQEGLKKRFPQLRWLAYSLI